MGNANGEGSIFYDKERKRWIGRISVPGTYGKKRRSVSAKTKAECRDKMRKLQAELEGGTTLDAERLSYGEYLDQWLMSSVVGSVKPATLVKYRIAITNHLKPSLGAVKLKRLTSLHLQNLYASKLREGYAPATIKIMHAVANRSLKQARQWRLILNNPAADATSPRAAQAREVRYLDRVEANRLLEAVRAWREDRYALFVVAISTGMRQGEILALRWSDVDLDRGEAIVARTVSTAHSPPSFGSPKGGRSRKVKLGTVAVEALKTHRQLQREARMLAEEWEDQNLVFAGPSGGVIRQQALGESYTRLLKREGFEHHTFHSLRHSAASLLLAAGAPHKSVQDLLGHSTIGVTMDRYSHIGQELRDDTASRMDALLE